MPSTEETKRLLDKQPYTVNSLDDSTKPEVKVFARRWYILALFSLLGAAQAIVWNTWGPIQVSARLIYGWSTGDIALLPTWGTVACTVVMFIGIWVMEKKGLRLAVTGSACTVLVATGIRCIPTSKAISKWVIALAHVINGAAGSVTLGGAPLVTSIWFPPNERTTATAVSSLSSYTGTAISFIIGPLFVPQPPSSMMMSNNGSSNSSLNGSLVNLFNATSTQYEIIKTDIVRLLIVEFAAVGVLAIPICIYFPSQPPIPPSLSAGVERKEFMKGLKDLIKHKHFWSLAFAFAAPVGVHGMWGTVLDVILDPIGIKQTTAGWMGFYSTIAGCVASLAFGRLADLFSGHLKLIISFLLFGALGSIVWFTLICDQIIPNSVAGTYISCIASGVFINSTLPLFYEITCETVYPISEGTTCAMLTVVNAILGVFFLLAFQVPQLDKDYCWANYVLIGSIAVSIPVLILSKEKYNRTNVDKLLSSESPSIQ